MTDLEILEQYAIDAAINLDWKIAENLNKKILKIDKNNLGAHLRMGFILIQSKDFKEAKKHYKAALKIQPSNQLAQENLEKIAVLDQGSTKKHPDKQFNFNPNLFLEVPGKTKSVLLVNPGQKNALAHLTVGEEVYIKQKARKIEVRSKNNEYLGTLPDDLSRRLMLFLKAGSLYASFIKDVSLSRVVIFIREEKRGKRVARYSSFPKNTHSNIARMTSDEDQPEVDERDVMESDLDRLADVLTHEDKDYLPYQTEEDEDENNEE